MNNKHLFYSGKIKSTNPNKYGIADSTQLSGHRQVKALEDLFEIPEMILSESGDNTDNDAIGQLWYVQNKECFYQLINWTNRGNENGWEEFKASGSLGIPVLNQAKINELGDEVPDEYLFIPSESDLEGEITNNTITTQSNGSYLDIIFKSLRALQMEVAKMRNAFKYGMVSYTGTQTAMSGALDDMGSTPDEEPLWAVDPDGLSLISDACIEITDEHELEPNYNVDVYDSRLVINNTGAEWVDRDEITKGNEDSKLFYYITSSNLNFEILLKDLDEKIENGQDPQNDYTLSISSLECGLSRYDVMIIISRKFPEEKSGEEETLYGENYIYLTITNPKTNFTVSEGYWDPSTNRLSPEIIRLDKRYYPNKLFFSDIILYKADLYSKFQEFSQEVIPSKPDDEEYKYKVAHLTIRAVSSREDLERIKDQLLENELIYEETEKILYIKNGYKLISIGAQSSSDGFEEEDGMKQEEIIELLKSLGIVHDSSTGLELSNLSDITFIHQGTGKAFKLGVDSEGEFLSTEIVYGEKTLEKRLKPVLSRVFPESVDPENVEEWRGFVALLHATEKDIKDGNSENSYKGTADLKLNADRVKISSMYCPLSTDVVFGCSHAFVELENTSDKDFPLDGCWLHWLFTSNIESSTVMEDGKEKIIESYTTAVRHLELSGIIPAGGTFLIRGKQYSDPEKNSNTFINVDSFDMEWFNNGSLIDFSQTIGQNKAAPHGFIMTYGKPNLKETDIIVKSNSGANSDKSPYLYKWYYIDSFLLNGLLTNNPWGPNKISSSSNSIIRNICALDPAKQAYNGLTTYDSSRARNAKVATDQQVLLLNEEYMSFPFSDEKYPIKRYTPKASKLGKNVSTDKSKLDLEKPNMVFCSFGLDAHKTRCFNWISCGLYDEYVFLKKSGETNYKAIQSYTKVTSPVEQKTDYPVRKEFSVDTNNAAYARINGVFPGDKTFYTSHKCIIDVLGETKTTGEKETWTYVVGRMDSNGQPDPEHCCDERTFTIYPNTFIPKVYHTTDQQGFHWIEYQMWAAAAKKLNEYISTDLEETEFPVLINTGDMTQNGTRINEWLDYYRGGECLFRHLEHMAVVGNNDLVNTDVTILGTGDDAGKSNGYFFHLFNCYEVNEAETNKTFEDGNKKKEFLPIVKGSDGILRYIPSLYYFDAGTNFRFIMCNSELTYINCRDWFKINVDAKAYNLYTGWYVPSSGTDNNTVNHLSTVSEWKNSFISVYEMMRAMMSNTTREKIVSCHEMPFTVITLECIATSKKELSRSVDKGGSSLVGCHMNQLSSLDKKSQYWFSRLCEEQGVKLVLGGHKHTYSITSPVRENYFYKDENNNWKWSASDGLMTMPDSLKDDTAVWTLPNDFPSTHTYYSKISALAGYNTSKLPITQNDDNQGASQSDYFKPYYPLKTMAVEDPTSSNYVIYVMNQATGYKQTSNKELPTNQQSFSCLIPQTNYDQDNVASADNNQKYPMVIVASLKNRTVDLMRFKGIAGGGYKFSQTAYGTSGITLEYAKAIENSKYCNWPTTKGSIINF